MKKAILLAWSVAVLACGASKNAQPGDGNGDGNGNGNGTTSCTVAGVSPTHHSGVGSCIGSTLLGAIGKDRLLVGMSGSDSAASAASYDLRYQYISSGSLPGPAACTSCTTNGCTAWWGCGWQETSASPGLFVPRFIQGAQGRSQIPMFTWYELLPSINYQEGQPEVDALQNATTLGKYLDDWRFFLQKVGNDVAFLHIEPDFWGYAQHANANAHAVPAVVTTANPTDCGSMENSVAGLGQCMIAMVRTYAPHAKVGLHASGWATGVDVLNNSNGSLDVAGQAQALATFLAACGAGQGDFVVADMSDRDSAYYQLVKGDPNRWWDATTAALPNFDQAFAWSKALAEALDVPVLWWQTPVGNSCQNNTNQHYQDNRQEYLFDHWDEVAAAHGLGVAFGAGNSDTTNLDTDSGALAGKVSAYVSAGGQSLCP